MISFLADAENRPDDTVRIAVGGVDAVHGETGVRGRDLLRCLLAQEVPAGHRLGPLGEPSLPFVLRAHQVVRDGLRQIGWQHDAEPGPERVMVREASGEVALDDDRGAVGQVVPDLLGGHEERREIEALTRLDAPSKVHLAA